MSSVIRVVGGAVLAMLLAGNASAQGVEVGLKAGYDGSRLAGAGAASTDTHGTGVGGVFLTWHVRPAFALQPEILFQKSTGFTSLSTGPTPFSVEQLAIPVLFEGTLPLARDLDADAYVGPQLGLRLDCSYTVDVRMGDMSCGGDPGPVPATEWSAVAGGGLGMSFEQTRVLLDARYDRGLTSVFESDQLGNAKLRHWEAMLGVAVPLHRTARTS